MYRTMASMGTKQGTRTARSGKHVDQATKFQPQGQHKMEGSLHEKMKQEFIWGMNGGPSQQRIQGTNRKPLAYEPGKKQYKQVGVGDRRQDPPVSVNSTTADFSRATSYPRVVRWPCSCNPHHVRRTPYGSLIAPPHMPQKEPH
ncbi:hypothetical protein V6N13_114021 [Hibiscus sabdariffa]|uniref:Uncharacterized protein n=1 Tax=Hibiscus sabdariffa TaxID=183260 RepID=A0ABR2U0J7_9ROSI